MLLKALYDYAQKHELFESLPLQKRTVHFLIPLHRDGTLRGDHLIALTHTNAKGKEEAGQERLMPRFPGENNGGKAYFLAESATAVLGCDKDTGECLPAPTAAKMKNPTKAFVHFWRQIEEAYGATQDGRLNSVLTFRDKYINVEDVTIRCNAVFFVVEDTKLYGVTGQGKKHALKTATIGFQIDGNPLTLDEPADPLRTYWFEQYSRMGFADEDSGHDAHIESGSLAPPCLITGQQGLPIARSHKPKILGVPGLASGGYIVSFAKESPAFSSYGFEMGQNAPISEKAAASYALAANALMDDNDTHLNLGPVAVCFWSKDIPQVAGQVNLLLNRAFPQQVRAFLKSPFAGVADRQVVHRERLHTIALTGNAGRVVVQHWLEQSLADAITHLVQWWDDLAVVPFYAMTQGAGENSDSHTSPIAIPNLARVSIHRSKKHKDDKLVASRIITLYRCALEGTTIPLAHLKPVLDEFHNALVKDSDDEPLYPLSESRFALIKLILVRNRKEGGFMPTYELADTSDAAYNLGRLLAVFENLQDKYHNYENKGAGVVERYYGTASSAPASAFPILCRLARHHLSKVRKEDGPAAYRIEERITEVLGKFQPMSPGKPPTFPRLLTLEGQGRFALGFYQQKARDRQNQADAAANKSKLTT